MNQNRLNPNKLNQINLLSEKRKGRNRQKIKFFKLSGLILLLVAILGSVFILNKKSKSVTSAVETPGVDKEGIPGWWYQQYFGSSDCKDNNCKLESDPDKDGLNNSQEFFYHSNPLSAYTSGDKLNDGELVAGGIDPSKSGRKTFDQIAAPENALGESLVFGKDIEKLVADDFDISKIPLPLVKDNELNVINNPDQKSYSDYASKLRNTIGKYFKESEIEHVKEILKSGSNENVEDIKDSASELSDELKTIAVPIKFLTFHKENIAMFKLMSEVILMPTNLSGPEGDRWFEKVQAFLAVQQKLNFEQQALNLSR